VSSLSGITVGGESRSDGGDVRGPRVGEFEPFVDTFAAEPALLPGHAVLRRLSSIDATDSFRFGALSL